MNDGQQGEREAHRGDPRVHECKRRNYITQKNKVNDRERIEMKKYCRWERTAHAAQGDPLTEPARRNPSRPGGSGRRVTTRQ